MKYKYLIPLIIPISSISAQFKIIQPKPDCNLFEKKHDGLGFSNKGGYWQTRIMWHLEIAVGSYIVDKVSKRILGNNKGKYITPSISIIPHIIGVSTSKYPINPGDIIYDTWTHSIGNMDKTKWIIGFVATQCFSSP